MARFTLPYSRTRLDLEVPDAGLTGVLESRVNAYTPPGPPEILVERAFDVPIGSPRLETLVSGARRITIITSDHTRPVPSRLTLPVWLRRIRKGRPDAEISILVATGCHRATTTEEQTRWFGEDLVRNERIVIHDSRDDAALVRVGTLPSGGELWLNRLAVETDLLLAEGFIEPHFFAGFSGGRKSVLPGVAGYRTVLANHCAAFIDSPSARTGILENNPIHADMVSASRQARLAFIMNVVLDADKRIIHAVAGHPETAHARGCEFLQGLCRVPRIPADIAVTTNGGFPLDQNIYQAVKGMTAAEAVCNEGGVIVMVAACEDGHGGRSFYERMANARSPREVLNQTSLVPMDKTAPDQWEYQILARILSRFTVILVTDRCDRSLVESMHMKHAATIGEAMDAAFRIKGCDARVTVIPDGVGVIVT